MVDVAVRVGEEVWEKLWTGLNFNHQCECRASFRPSGWDVPFSFEVQAGLESSKRCCNGELDPSTDGRNRVFTRSSDLEDIATQEYHFFFQEEPI